jgi:hypothetical protein
VLTFAFAVTLAMTLLSVYWACSSGRGWSFVGIMFLGTALFVALLQ